jgi:hypothetical protein
MLLCTKSYQLYPIIESKYHFSDAFNQKIEIERGRFNEIILYVLEYYEDKSYIRKIEFA